MEDQVGQSIHEHGLRLPHLMSCQGLNRSFMEKTLNFEELYLYWGDDKYGVFRDVNFSSM